MEELFCLVDYGLDDLGVGVAGVADGDPGGEIQEAIAVHVNDRHALAPLDDQGVIPGVGLGDVIIVLGHDGPGLGSG